MTQNNRPSRNRQPKPNKLYSPSWPDVLDGDLAHYAEETMSRSEIRTQPSDGEPHI